MVVSHDSHVSYDHVRVAGSDAGGISAEARSLSSSAMPDSYAAPFAAFSGAVPTLPLTGRLSTIICQQCPEFRVWSIPAGGVKGFRHPLRESSPPLRGQYIIGKDDDDCISHRPQSLPLAFVPSVLSFVAAMRVSIVFDDDPLFGVCDIDCRLVSQLRNEYLPVFDRLRQSMSQHPESAAAFHGGVTASRKTRASMHFLLPGNASAPSRNREILATVMEPDDARSMASARTITSICVRYGASSAHVISGCV